MHASGAAGVNAAMIVFTRRNTFRASFFPRAGTAAADSLRSRTRRRRGPRRMARRGDSTTQTEDPPRGPASAWEIVCRFRPSGAGIGIARRAVMAFITMWRRNGRRCVFVTDPGRTYLLRLVGGDQICREESVSSPDLAYRVAGLWADQEARGVFSAVPPDRRIGDASPGLV